MKKKTFRNSVKGNNSCSKSYVTFSIIVMAAQALVIIVLAMALTMANNGPKYVVDKETGEVVKVREDRPVKYGAIRDGDHVIGRKDAKVVFVWYVDMQCPACAQMMPIVESIYEKYGKQVAFVTRHLTLKNHTYARPAAIAVEAAAKQGYFWEMTKELFEQRAEWVYVNNDDLLNQRIAKIFIDASDGKGDKERFLSDLTDEELGKKVDADDKLARDDGMNATPSIVIDGTFIDFTGSNQDVSTMFTDALDAALAK